jgi:two-component system, response regulator, stage 0 sporulation protein F
MAEDARHRRVLLVDDEEDLRTLVSSIVADLGYEVATARDGISAIEKAEEDPPDLILLDLLLPGIDGTAVLRYLREGGSRVPIVLLTACSDERTLRRAMREGATAYLPKPFRIRDLAEICQRFLGPHLSERRREPRHPVSLDLLGLSSERVPLGLARLVDLSTGGAQVGFAAPLDPGERIRMAFPVPGGELDVAGRVCWRAPASPGYAHGLAFEALAPAQERHILRLLASPE